MFRQTLFRHCQTRVHREITRLIMSILLRAPLTQPFSSADDFSSTDCICHIHKQCTGSRIVFSLRHLSEGHPGFGHRLIGMQALYSNRSQRYMQHLARKSFIQSNYAYYPSGAQLNRVRHPRQVHFLSIRLPTACRFIFGSAMLEDNKTDHSAQSQVAGDVLQVLNGLCSLNGRWKP